ncbi:MAG: Rtr1/RPAP2 family-domain-containing protein [Benjaminiella poitrasii]|nr:MAG: Rtr1/RPAP2 family-domain-containing protein [Benjaminiella poitrasii]
MSSMTANTSIPLEKKSSQIPKVQGKTPVRRRKKQLTPKQKLMKESAEHRLKIEKLVFVWQEKLFSQPKATVDNLERAATYLQPKTYAEVIEERVVQEWCGYPLCDNTPKTQNLQKYKISISQRKVYDQSELANYCSDACYHKSKYYNLQLSEEPVWFRDLSVMPNMHVVPTEDDFQTAVEQRRNKPQPTKSSQELRSQYVQHLLGNVSKDAKEQVEIVEKSTEVPSSVANGTAGVFDSIEGYQIEVKNDGNKPTTLILKKTKDDTQAETETANKHQKAVETKQEEEQQDTFDPDDPDALFETMMMLKDMNMDKEEYQSNNLPEAKSIVAEKKPDTPVIVGKEEKKEDFPKTTSTTVHETTSEHSTLQKPSPSKEVEADKDTNVIKVTTQKPKKTVKKKKKRVPELSLFGTVWTMLDHLTTKATRVYLTELQNTKQRVDVSHLLKEDKLIAESNFLRGQIFSERVLDTYSLIRAQLGIKENLEDDIVNVIRTFRFSDATIVALDSAQCYMVALVLIKSVGDILLEDMEWKTQFEDCCKTVNQSTDMVDACVRVLKVASV